MKIKLLIILALLVVSVNIVTAQTTEFTYQGKLTDGVNAANGNYDFEFALYDSLSAGTQQGSTLTRNPVAVASGIFTVTLDFGNQFTGANRYLEIRLRPTGNTGGYQQLLPRQQVNSAPYSVKALTADTATNATNATNATQLGGQTASFYQNAANLNAGTLNAARLPVPLSLTGSVSGIGIISGTNSSTSGYGVVGITSAGTGTNYGGYFHSASTSGQGVFGFASATSGINYGGRFQSDSTNGSGVSGEATATSGTNYGVYGRNNSPTGYGVYGTSVGNVGVYGAATATTGLNYGAWGQSDSTGGIGVYGGAISGTGINFGVRGFSNSPDGYAGYFTGRGYFSGNVGLGVLTPTFKLQLSTDSAAKPTSSSWTISSDRRLKKNILPIDGALDRLMHLRGVTYQWRDPASQGDMAGTYTGMIAQDVEKVFPEWIREDANGFKTLTVIGFEGIVVEALRELRAEKDAEISGQQSEINALRQQIQEQRVEIDAFKTLVCSQNPAAVVCRPKN